MSEREGVLYCSGCGKEYKRLALSRGLDSDIIYYKLGQAINAVQKIVLSHAFYSICKGSLVFQWVDQMIDNQEER